MAYGDPSSRHPRPSRPPPDDDALLAAAQRHLDNAGVSACVVRSVEGDLLVAVGSPADKLFAMLARQMPGGSGQADR